jgi:Phage integrase family
MKPSLEIRLTSAPHADEPVAKHSPNKGRKLAPEEVQAILDACPDTPTGIRNRALVTLMYHSGLKVSEALNLQTSSIDFRTHSVQLLYTKSGVPQTRSFRPGADDALKRWIQKREELGLGPGPLFCTVVRPSGRPLSGQYVRRLTADLAKRAGIDKRVHPNVFRDTFAAEAIQSGANLAELKEQLGHKNIGHTALYIDDLTNSEPIARARRQIYGASETEDQPDLLVRLYIPSTRLYAAEADRLFSMFSDWLTATHGQGIRQSGYRTASGEMYEFFADSSIVRTDPLEQFDTFSNFLDLCIHDPSAAIDLLTQNNVERSSGSDLVVRFSKEARRLKFDLRQERERRIMRLKHDLENQLMNSAEELGETPDSLIDGLLENLVPRPSAPESLALLGGSTSVRQVPPVTFNVSQQIIHGATSTIIQSVQGEVNLSPEAKKMLAFIEKYGGGEVAALKSAVYELEDSDAQPEYRSKSKDRLKRFLRQAAGTVQGVGVDLLTKYLESKIP